jgi:hypothetical protein
MSSFPERRAQQLEPMLVGLFGTGPESLQTDVYRPHSGGCYRSGRHQVLFFRLAPRHRRMNGTTIIDAEGSLCRALTVEGVSRVIEEDSENRVGSCALACAS